MFKDKLCDMQYFINPTGTEAQYVYYVSTLFWNLSYRCTNSSDSIFTYFYSSIWGTSHGGRRISSYRSQFSSEHGMASSQRAWSTFSAFSYFSVLVGWWWECTADLHFSLSNDFLFYVQLYFMHYQSFSSHVGLRGLFRPMINNELDETPLSRVTPVLACPSW